MLIALGLLATVCGFVLFIGVLKLFPVLEKRENISQRDEVIAEAKKQIEIVKEDFKRRDVAAEVLLQEEVEESYKTEQELLSIEEQDIASRETLLVLDEKRVEKIEQKVSEKEADEARLTSEWIENVGKIEELKKNILIPKLEFVAKQASQTLLNKTAEQKIEHRQLECQKVLKFMQEEINSSSRKIAQQILDRTLTRYQPSFIWPKSINHVEVNSLKLVTKFSENEFQLIEQLKEVSGVNVQFKLDEEEKSASAVIRVAGGFGINRESMRLALHDAIERNKVRLDSIKELYENYQKSFNAEAVILGKKAVNQLKLKGIHPEIQKLVGALNWRTSYRQNQWYHTVEVATLAGVLAEELGVDPDAAKRVGLLHDIGKAIDYRIEGSHAVISGDYADRFGETRLICDTVMSHHADLLVESPLAYVLRAADTLSGARPGARVNLEEGYQIRIGAIYDVVNSFRGITDVAVMNGGREVHIQVDCDKIKDDHIKVITEEIKKKITEDVTFPGQIKILVTRVYESISVA